MKKLVVSGIAIAALGLSVVSCGDSGPSCVDWDTHKVKQTVTPKPEKVHKKGKWVNGRTPAPYVTTIKTKYCDEWETKSSSPSDN